MPAKRGPEHYGKDSNHTQMQSYILLCGSPKHRKPGAGLFAAQGSFVGPNPWRPGLASRFCAGPSLPGPPQFFPAKALGKSSGSPWLQWWRSDLAWVCPNLRRVLWTGPGCVRCVNSNITSFVFTLLALRPLMALVS